MLLLVGSHFNNLKHFGSSALSGGSSSLNRAVTRHDCLGSCRIQSAKSSQTTTRVTVATKPTGRYVKGSNARGVHEVLRRRRLAGGFTPVNLTQASFQAVNTPPAIPKRGPESGLFGVPNHNSIGSFDPPPKDLPDYLSPALFTHLLRLESTQRAETSNQFYKYTKAP